MKYFELCQAFYISTTVGGLKDKTSQGTISEFFVKMGLTDESCEAVMPTNISSFDKWFSGINNQHPKIWNAFRKDFNEDAYVNAICERFNEDNLEIVAKKLNISVRKGEKIRKQRFGLAIARQMSAFANGKGEADNIINDVYSVNEIQVDFSEYIEKATERYNVMKLIGGDEVPLEEYFICNTLGERQRVVADKTKMKCKYLENATLTSIRTMYGDRFDNKKTILIGSGGSGKSLMLQHMFLDAVAKYPETGILPIFLELRYFTQADDIKSYIIKTVNLKDDSFTEEIAHRLLLDGKCQVLLDGLDEIDPSDINDFQLKLNAFTDKYPRTQVVLASRDCDAITGLNGYIKLYVWPFDNDQSLELIDKILAINGDEAAKDKILEYIDNGFIKKDGAFASHPMLLTFVAMNYPKFESFYGNHLLFYKVAYDALLTGHDDNKKPYDRVFHSVDNSDQFSKVFREFCGETYRQGVLEFDKASFDKYFSELTSYKEFENPNKMNAKSFRQDACSTACMMYEKELGIWYIDPGFQEFLFAEYYSLQNSEKAKELGLSLRGQPLSKYKKLDAFEMLYNFSNEKVKVCIFLPFLESIFKGKSSEEESFAEFLCEGYEKVTYTVIDKDLVEKYENYHNVRYQISISGINEPRTVILSFILKLLEEPPTFTYLTTNSSAERAEFSTIALTGEYAHMTDTEERLFLRRNLQNQFIDREKFERTHDTANYIRNEYKEIVCFGHEYEIDSYDMHEEPEKFIEVIRTMMQDDSEVYKTYQKIKAYYKQLNKEQYINRFK